MEQPPAEEQAPVEELEQPSTEPTVPVPPLPRQETPKPSVSLNADQRFIYEILAHNVTLMTLKDQMGKIKIGKDVPGQFKNDLELEKGAVTAYNRAVETCRKAGDNATADFLKEILKDEEAHVDYLETQLSLIDQSGLPVYLTEQMKG